MRSVFRIIAGLFLVASVCALPRTSRNDYIKVFVNGKSFYCNDIITRDICVIGGGSAGTYAALGLKDRNKSLVIIEKDRVLGGHTNTYRDPTTGVTVDIGVLVFHNLPIVKSYFARYNIPLTAYAFPASKNNCLIDFRTGKLANFVPPSALAENTALAAYATQLAKYPNLTTGWNLPYPVPADLLIPFGDFITKYNLGGIVQQVFEIGQGLGDFLTKPTVYVFNNFGLATVTSVESGFLSTARHNNAELYEHAFAELGSNVLLKSYVIATDRASPGPAKLLVQDSHGRLTFILADKIVFTAPPKLDNLVGFDLDSTEKGLFSQFQNSGYYTALLNCTGLAPNTTVTNYGSDTPYNIPVLPGIYYIGATAIPGLFNVKYGSATALPEEFVKKDIIASIKRLGVLTTESDPEFVWFKNHSPFELSVSVDAIKRGFYKDLYALQGRNKMYYTGAAFRAQDSALLWEFTEALLPTIAA